MGKRRMATTRSVGLLLALAVSAAVMAADAVPEQQDKGVPEQQDKGVPEQQDKSIPEQQDDGTESAPQVERLPGTMTLLGLFDLVRKIDPEAKIAGNTAEFTVRGSELILVGDEKAGRMRIMLPIVRMESVDAAKLQRMLQANFDAVLDSRYAIAHGVVWSVFIHPLPPLDEAQFANAVSQVYVAAATFGAEYTSGAFVYGGGDSNEVQRKLLEELNQTLAPAI